MSEKNGHIVNEEMLYRYFAKELSEIEKALVEDWKSISEENQKKFEEAHVFYLDMKALASIEKLDNARATEKSWEQFKIKQDFATKTVNSNEENEISLDETKIVSFPYYKVAAAILLTIVASWIIFGNSSNDEDHLITAEKSKEAIELTDGSMITLNSSSAIEYSDTYNKKERRVKLKGEAYFEVDKNPEKPFVVDLNLAEIQVIGTAFNVNTNEDNSIIVDVKEGKVRFYTSKNEKILTAGQSAKLNTETLEFESLGTTSNQAHFWRTSNIKFDGHSLDLVIADLESIYDVNIKLDDPILAKCTLTVNFENESLDNILEVITTTLNLQVEQINDIYHLSGQGCQ